MKVRIEVDWEELVGLVGHAKAKGLCRKTEAEVVYSGPRGACLGCGSQITKSGIKTPWEKNHVDER